MGCYSALAAGEGSVPCLRVHASPPIARKVPSYAPLVLEECSECHPANSLKSASCLSIRVSRLSASRAVSRRISHVAKTPHVWHLRCRRLAARSPQQRQVLISRPGVCVALVMWSGPSVRVAPAGLPGPGLVYLISRHFGDLIARRVARALGTIVRMTCSSKPRGSA